MGPDVVVVGGGVIGCAVGYRVARRGGRALVLEDREAGHAASGAKAGMLAAQAEAHEPGPFVDLLLAARNRHRALADDLAELTGLDPGYVWAGSLRVAVDGDARGELLETRDWQSGLGLDARWLEPAEALELEPHVTDDIDGALYLAGDGQVNPPDVVTALVAGMARLGSEVREFTRVTGFRVAGDRIAAVRTTQGDIAAGAVVLAAGPWTGGLAGELGIRFTIYPVKGEMIVTQVLPFPIKANVWDADKLYLVPKRDGRVVIGATEEPHVHDHRPTLGGIAALSRAAIRLVPKLSEALFDYAWGGLRPATPSGEPVLGRVPRFDNLFMAAGHFRNGVLLSAVTGEALAALALGEKPDVDLSHFSPERAIDFD
jgi:glycine oxidase